MKSLILFSITLLMLSSSYAQQNVDSKQNAEKFINYFNTEKTDSLRMLLAENVKSKLSLQTLGQTIKQLKAGLGNLRESEYFGVQKGANIYIATFERSGPVLYIVFDSSNKIIGFYVDADKRKMTNSFTLKTPDAVLRGTLSIPETAKAVPVVLLIAGSGPTDRDGNSQLISGKSNYFLQISNALKMKNIAVLRYDKRAVGQSTTTTPIEDIVFDDMVNDATAIIRNLKADKRFSKIIVAGHSEGALVGMLAVEREKADAFISLSGPAFPADIILKTQLKTKFTSDDYKNAVLIIDSIKTGNFTKQIIDTRFSALFNQSVQPYLSSWMKFDPKKIISELNLPVLIVQGTTDLQVSVSDAEALKNSDPNAQLKILTGMNHVFRETSSDIQRNLATYTMPDLPLHPDLIPVLTGFIDKLK